MGGGGEGAAASLTRRAKRAAVERKKRAGPQNQPAEFRSSKKVSIEPGSRPESTTLLPDQSRRGVPQLRGRDTQTEDAKVHAKIILNYHYAKVNDDVQCEICSINNQNYSDLDFN